MRLAFSAEQQLAVAYSMYVYNMPVSYKWAVRKRTKAAVENFVFRAHFVDIIADKNENAGKEMK